LSLKYFWSCSTACSRGEIRLLLSGIDTETAAYDFIGQRFSVSDLFIESFTNGGQTFL
jgi:predicted HD phosphohydrolase